ncbi:hypothetical protein IEQ34_015895 [Dendrobium chrysotoxum]|uniref:UspA domain-containing protein n=1 Tax=Dendrobium chrysotoxum TaxID=161865 RepID=A0AAV7GJJ1_DENCH|nr:hypothetical protein IEQ34_015895 [Dendrobium chrysotoxum]
MESADRGGPLPPTKRRVMVIADASRESSVALQWALSHAILEQDDLILLHVETSNPSRRGGGLSAFLRRPTSSGNAGNQQHHHQLALTSTSSSSSSSSSSTGSAVSAGSGDVGEYDFLEAMRAACEAAQPKVKVQVEKVEMEGRVKAAVILSQTKLLGVDLLVIGQRRSGSSFLGCKLSGSMSGRGLDTAEFLIEHCKCLCVGVQKKGQNAGYLLNTKTHKNFWLLA